MHENQFKNMATQKQIIAFIDPRKFGDLLGDNKPQGYRQNGSNLDNGYKLVYIQTDGTHDVAAYDEAKAKAASIILVPDSFNFQYVPEVPFKILWHGGTDETTRVRRLRDITNHFQGDEKSQEEENTPYQKIADLIKAALKSEQPNVTFESIHEDIKEFDQELEKLLEPFATANPFKAENTKGDNLKQAKEALNTYVKSKS